MWFTAMWCIFLMLQQVGGPECGGVEYVFGMRDVARAPRTSSLLQRQDNTPHCCKPQSYVPEDGQNDFPKHAELIQRSIKLLLLHLVGHLYQSPKLMMHGQTQIKFTSNLPAQSVDVLWNTVSPLIGAHCIYMEIKGPSSLYCSKSTF